MPPHRTLISVSLLLTAITAYHLTFRGFFESANPISSGIGHDYSAILPIYLDGYYWFINNGFMTPPWFTPAFCGGQPCYADPQSVFYSPGQFLTFILDPLTASYLAFWGFASVGYLSMFWYCRKALQSDTLPSCLAAILWMFNGFFTHHYLVGHVTFAPLVFAPAVALILSPPVGEKTTLLLGRIGLGSLVVFACFHAGLGSLMIPFALSVLGLASIAVLRGSSGRLFSLTSAGSAVLILGLAASKLVLASSLMASFPRSHYRLPGVADPLDLAKVILHAFSRPDEEVIAEIAPMFVNRDIGIGPHEMAFDVTPIPFVLIAAAIICWIVKGSRTGFGRLSGNNTLALGSLVVALLLPAAINYYTPDWNLTLKSLPVLSSTSAPWRWFVVYIPILCAGAALAVHHLVPASSQLRNTLTITSILLVLLLKVSLPRIYYHEQPYDPTPILEAYSKAREPSFKPIIRHIGTYTDDSGQVVRTHYQNDLIAIGVSQMYCYNPLFGYWLENFPAGMLRRGSVFSVRDGYLNLKDPSCYVFPQENSCQPGDHFRADDEGRSKAEAFVNYRPWSFGRSARMAIAENVTAISLLIAAVLSALGLAGLCSAYKRVDH